VENLKRVALLGSGYTSGIRPNFGRRIEVAGNKGVWRRAAMVHSTMLTHRGEFGYEFLCRTMSKYTSLF
jgi:hypothetical protein